jgi:hypothetical protein
MSEPVSVAILAIAHLRLPSERFKQLLRVLDAWQRGLLTTNFACYEVEAVVGSDPVLVDMTRAYFGGELSAPNRARQLTGGAGGVRRAGTSTSASPPAKRPCGPAAPF